MPDPTPSPSSPEGEEISENSLPEISPDEREQALADETDNIIPTKGYHMLPVVALGGSAGSIPALEKFFAVTPCAAGAAYVVVLHLSPEHESALPAVLQRCTKMPLRETRNTMKVEPNTVYVIPPGKHLTLTGAEEALRVRNEELERFNLAAVGRELRMVELKKEINALLAQRGEPPRFAVNDEDLTTS